MHIFSCRIIEILGEIYIFYLFVFSSYNCNCMVILRQGQSIFLQQQQKEFLQSDFLCFKDIFRLRDRCFYPDFRILFYQSDSLPHILMLQEVK